MSSPATPQPSIEQLLSDLSWLRSFAHTLVSASEVEDLVQETAVRALSKPPKKKGNLRAWIKAIARNKALTDQRQHQTRRRIELERIVPTLGEGTEDQTPEDEAAYNESVRQLFRVISDLPEKHFEVLIAFYHQGRSQAELAREWNTTEKAVERRIARAKELCEAALRSQHGERWFAPCVVFIQGFDALTVGKTAVASSAASSSAVTGSGAALSPKYVAVAAAAAIGFGLIVPSLMESDQILDASSATTQAHLGIRGPGDLPAPDLRILLEDDDEAGSSAATSASDSGATVSYSVLVRNADEQAVPGARVWVRPDRLLKRYELFDFEGQLRSDLDYVTSDEDGRAVVLLEKGQDNWITASAPGFTHSFLKIAGLEGADSTQVTLEIAPEARFVGTLRSTQGSPLAGVTVAAFLASRGRPVRSTPEFLTQTDAEGSFSFAGLPPDHYLVRISGEAIAAQWLNLEPLNVGDNEGSFEIRPGDRVSGTVHSESGQALAGARVFAVSAEEVQFSHDAYALPRWVEPVLTDANGRFVLNHADLSRGDSLVARMPGYRDRKLDDLTPGAPAEFVLASSQLRIEVRAFANRKQIHDPKVSATWTSGSLNSSRTTTSELDDDGRSWISLDRASPDVLLGLTVYAPEGWARVSGARVPADGRPIDLDLNPGSLFTFRVVDQHGEPVEGYRLYCEALMTSAAGEPVFFSSAPVTNEDGEVQYQFPVAQVSVSRPIPGEDTTFLVPNPVHVDGQTPAEMEIRLVPRIERYVRVTDSHGRPVTKRSIAFETLEGGFGAVARTDARGIAHVTEWMSGSFMPMVQAPHERLDSHRAAGTPLTVTEGQENLLETMVSDLHDLRVRLQAPPGTPAKPGVILLPVTDEAHLGLAYGDAAPRALFDADGWARLEQVPEGKYLLVACGESDSPHWITSVSVPGPGEEFHWVPRGAAVQGQLRGDPESWQGRKLVLRPRALTSPSGSTTAERTYSASTEIVPAEDGSFRFPFIPEGDWRLQLSGEGLQPLAIHELNVNADSGNVLDLGRLQMEAAGSVRVELVHGRADAVREALFWTIQTGVCELRNRDTLSWYSLTPNEAGIAHLNGLPPGSYEFWALGQMVDPNVMIVGGEETVLRFE